MSENRSGAALNRKPRLRTLFFLVDYNDEKYSIKLSSENLCIHLMHELSQLTNIPIRLQKLTGWPFSITENLKVTKLKNLSLSKTTTLKLTRIEDNLNEEEQDPTSIPSTSACVSSSSHKISFNRCVSSNNTATATPHLNYAILDHDQSTQESNLYTPENNPFNDSFTSSDNSSTNDYDSTAQDHDEQEQSVQLQLQNFHYLISDKVEDEMTGVMEFIRNFTQRYNQSELNFFTSTLEDAKKEAFDRSITDKKFLAIFIYNGRSSKTDHFCNVVLFFENNVSLLNENCVLYGWDTTFESNRNFLLSTMMTVGETASLMVRNISEIDLPALMLIGNRNNRIYEVLRVICSNDDPKIFETCILEAISLYDEIKGYEFGENEKRVVRETIKHEQEEEYKKSLEADMAKENARKLKENELKEEQKRVELENLRNQEIQQRAKSALPKEPDDSVDKANVVYIRFRIKSASGFLNRQFKRTDKIQDLLNYLTSEGFQTQKYKILRYPWSDLSTMDPNLTLESMGFNQFETLLIF